uniref:Uncharacterized protein n=1 Tax=Salix viminalis TaxID=40686 RepID=A0A6N2LEH2_SALVM
MVNKFLSKIYLELNLLTNNPGSGVRWCILTPGTSPFSSLFYFLTSILKPSRVLPFSLNWWHDYLLGDQEGYESKQGNCIHKEWKQIIGETS